MRALLSAAPSSAQTVVLTVQKNGGDTALTCTITGAAQSGSDLTHSVSFAAGDTINLKSSSSATAATTVVHIGLQGVVLSP